MTTTLTTITHRITTQQDTLQADPPTIASPYTGDPQTAIVYQPGTHHIYANGIEVGTVQVVGTYRGVTALYTLGVKISARHYEDGPTLRYTLSNYRDAQLLHGQTASLSSMTDAHTRYVSELAADTLGAVDGERITYTHAQAVAALAYTIAPDVKRKAREFPDSAYSEAAYRLRQISALDTIIKYATGPDFGFDDLDAIARMVARDALKKVRREVVEALAKLA